MHPGVRHATDFCATGNLPQHMGWDGRGDAAMVRPAKDGPGKAARERVKLETSEREPTALVGTMVLVQPNHDQYDAQLAVVLEVENRHVHVASSTGARRRKVLEPFFRVRYVKPVLILARLVCVCEGVQCSDGLGLTCWHGVAATWSIQRRRSDRWPTSNDTTGGGGP